MLLVMPVIAGTVAVGLAVGVGFCLKHVFLYNVEAELKAIRRTLEEKYNLPPDILLSGPTAGYKHNARRGSR